MNTGISISKNMQVWEQLFTGAFEADQTKLLERIADAENVLLVRAQQLFGPAEDNIEELQALDDAMYVLHSLRSAVRCQGRGASELPTDEEWAA